MVCNPTAWDYSRECRTLSRKAGYTAQEQISYTKFPSPPRQNFPLPHDKIEEKHLWRCILMGECMPCGCVKQQKNRFWIQPFLCMCVHLHMPVHSQNTPSPTEPKRVCKHTECSTHFMFTHTGEQLNTAITASISMHMHTDKTWDFQQSLSNSV